MTVAADGKYEVLFEYPGGWAQRNGLVVEAGSPWEAVAAAFAGGGWVGLGNGEVRVKPTHARVRYTAVSLIEGCARNVATVMVAGSRVFERLPRYQRTGSGVAPEDWIRA